MTLPAGLQPVKHRAASRAKPVKELRKNTEATLGGVGVLGDRTLSHPVATSKNNSLFVFLRLRTLLLSGLLLPLRFFPLLLFLSRLFLLSSLRSLDPLFGFGGLGRLLLVAVGERVGSTHFDLRGQP